MKTRDELLELLESERQLHKYSASSPWYRSTKSAIERLKLADEASSASDQFSNLWLAVNHLYNPVQRSGEEENTALSRWGTEIVVAPGVEASLRRISKEALETIKRAESKLLYHFQEKRDREGKLLLDTWLRKYPLANSSKAIQYLLGISRDCRNATFHANFDPSNRNVVKAMEALADILNPFARAAIEATIRHPIPGTTGRVPTYRGFLWPFFSNSNGFFSDYYLKELLPEQELGAFPEEESLDLLKGVNKSFQGSRAGLAAADAQQTAKMWLEPVLFPALDLDVVPGPELVGAEEVYQPDYVIPSRDHRGSLAVRYRGKEAGEHIVALVFVLPWGASLDGTRPGADATKQTALQWVQDALRATDVPWAMLTNGQQLRLLRKEVAFQARSFVELDLSTILLRLNNSQDRADAIRAFRYGRCLFSGPSCTEPHRGERTRLEHILEESRRHGAELGEELKQNVFRALEQLGEGFRYFLETHPEARKALREKLAPALPEGEFMTSEPLLDKIYEGSLALMYRLLFLFYAESRDLLPMDVDLYREEYSLESLRDEVAERRDSPDERRRFVKGSHELYGRLRELFGLVNGSAPTLVPVFNGGLFDPARHWMLEKCEVVDYYLAEAIDQLSRTQLPWRTGLVKVTYRDLSVRHLGEIYEGILEYHAHIATEDHVVLERTRGGRKEEEYEPVAKLSATDKQQLRDWLEARQAGTPPPSRNKVTGFKEKGSYFLVYGGRESKRKSSGSYYTPDYIVQYIVENTLGPLVRGENREGELKGRALSSAEILDLKVLDPAMGSGHFLVAALEYLATAYWEALNREGEDDDGIMSDEEYTLCKRRVAERCIYGVDINPLAVELGKLSIWLTTMDKERPLSFLNHHVKCGNSLLGAWIEDLGTLPGGKPLPGQPNLFEQHFKARVPMMVRDVLGIMKRDTQSIHDVKAKRALDDAIEQTRAPFVKIANTWVATYFGEEARDYDALLTDLSKAARRKSVSAGQKHFFHWELEFPEVWFDEHGRARPTGGFDAVIGNPPYANLQTFEDPVKLRYLPNSPAWRDFYRGQADIHYYFTYQALRILSPDGRFGFITSRYWLEATYADTLRETLSREATELCIIDLNHNPVFESASIHTLILLGSTSEAGREWVYYRAGPRGMSAREVLTLDQSKTQAIEELGSGAWTFSGSATDRASLLAVGDLARIGMGVSTGLNNAFIVRTKRQDEFEVSTLRPLIKNGKIARYGIVPSDALLLFTELSTQAEIPKTIAHLAKYRNELIKRRGCDSIDRWYKFKENQNFDLAEYNEWRIITPYRGAFPRFAPAPQGAHGCTDTYSILPHEHSRWPIFALLALLNSSWVRKWFEHHGKKKGSVIEFFTRPIQSIPLPPSPDPSLEALGRRMTELTGKLIRDLLPQGIRLQALYEPSFELVSQRYDKLGGRASTTAELCQQLAELDKTVDGTVSDLYASGV
jgi:hypothetical protein